jgi:hypothetical protein
MATLHPTIAWSMCVGATRRRHRLTQGRWVLSKESKVIAQSLFSLSPYSLLARYNTLTPALGWLAFHKGLGVYVFAKQS